jgi:hypothetical protein
LSVLAMDVEHAVGVDGERAGPVQGELGSADPHSRRQGRAGQAGPGDGADPAVCFDPPDPVVEMIGDVEHAEPVHGDPVRGVQLGAEGVAAVPGEAGLARTDAGGSLSSRGDPDDPVLQGLRDVQRSVARPGTAVACRYSGRGSVEEIARNSSPPHPGSDSPTK